MKKNLLIMFLLVFIVPAFADIVAPQWNDIAPRMFEDISTEQEYKLPTYQYWRDRRIKFNNSVVECQEKFDGEDLVNCYEQIKSLEKSKNEMREQVQFEKILRNRPMI